ncbi:MAG: hypothetical protein ACXVCP_03590 [Bdellovibrio sp.]
MRILFVFLAAMTLNFVNGQRAQAATPSCTLVSEGIYNGWWVKHRIVLEEKVVYGANDIDSIVSQLENLREQGLCR